MTVKLLSEEEIKRLGGLMFAPAEDAERVQASLRWAVRAAKWIREQGDHGMTCDADCRRTPCTCGLTALLAELTPPTPEER